MLNNFLIRLFHLFPPFEFFNWFIHLFSKIDFLYYFHCWSLDSSLKMFHLLVLLHYFYFFQDSSLTTQKVQALLSFLIIEIVNACTFLRLADQIEKKNSTYKNRLQLNVWKEMLIHVKVLLIASFSIKKKPFWEKSSQCGGMCGYITVFGAESEIREPNSNSSHLTMTLYIPYSSHF